MSLEHLALQEKRKYFKKYRIHKKDIGTQLKYIQWPKLAQFEYKINNDRTGLEAVN